MNRHYVLDSINEIKQLYNLENGNNEEIHSQPISFESELIGGGRPRKHIPLMYSQSSVPYPYSHVGGSLISYPSPYGYGGRNIAGCNLYGGADHTGYNTALKQLKVRMMEAWNAQSQEQKMAYYNPTTGKYDLTSYKIKLLNAARDQFQDPEFVDYAIKKIQTGKNLAANMAAYRSQNPGSISTIRKTRKPALSAYNCYPYVQSAFLTQGLVPPPRIPNPRRKRETKLFTF